MRPARGEGFATRQVRLKTPMELVDQVGEEIRKRQLIPAHQRVLVAVSGGLDSVVLLDILGQLASAFAWELEVAHADHQLRPESAQDAEFVHKMAQANRLAFHEARLDVKEYGEREGGSVEMAARDLRHDFLAKTARRGGHSCIALGHHADDQLELFFLRVLRGTGSAGIGGMKWSSPSPADRDVCLVRPLLGCTRDSLAAYARQRQLAFREDVSNASMDFRRNRIRHELLPLLRRNYNLGDGRCVLRLMEIMDADSEYVQSQTEAWLVALDALQSDTDRRSDLTRTPFSELPVPLQRQCICLQLRKAGYEPDFELVEQLRNTPCKKRSLRSGVCVTRDLAGRVLVEGQADPELEFRTDRIIVEMGVSGSASLAGTSISWETVTEGYGAPQEVGRFEVFDADTIGGRFILRHWQRGDRFHPIGLGQSTKLQDLFTNLRIRREIRHKLVLAVSDAGEIFWVEGLRISEGHKVTNRTKRRLFWCWSHRE